VCERERERVNRVQTSVGSVRHYESSTLRRSPSPLQRSSTSVGGHLAQLAEERVCGWHVQALQVKSVQHRGRSMPTVDFSLQVRRPPTSVGAVSWGHEQVGGELSERVRPTDGWMNECTRRPSRFSPTCQDGHGVERSGKMVDRNKTSRDAYKTHFGHATTRPRRLSTLVSQRYLNRKLILGRGDPPTLPCPACACSAAIHQPTPRPSPPRTSSVRLFSHPHAKDGMRSATQWS
jgi:hypothetical protein